MALDNFLKIDQVEGDSVDSRHSREIDVLSWSFGMSNATSIGTRGGGSGKVNVQDLHIVKPTDSSTPLLMEATCASRQFAGAWLSIRRTGYEASVFFQIKMRNVMVTSIQTGFLPDHGLADQVTLTFASFQVQFTSTDENDQPGQVKTGGWNIASNRPE